MTKDLSCAECYHGYWFENVMKRKYIYTKHCEKCSRCTIMSDTDNFRPKAKMIGDCIIKERK